MNQLNFFRNLIVCSLLGVALLYSFDGYFDKRIHVIKAIPKVRFVVLNPLDAILGEKKLDDGSLRKDNFQSILKIKASFLGASSRLYTVRKVTDQLFLLTRKQFFYQNRKYSLFVKTAGDRIVYCYPVMDFVIRDLVFSDQRIYFISDDYSEIAGTRSPSYTVKITCTDQNFLELWQTASIPNKGYFFYGEMLSIQDNQLIARIGIRNEGSSTMCVDNFNIMLKKSGKIIGAVYTGGYSCGGRNISGSVNLTQLFH